MIGDDYLSDCWGGIKKKKFRQQNIMAESVTITVQRLLCAVYAIKLLKNSHYILNKLYIYPPKNFKREQQNRGRVLLNL